MRDQKYDPLTSPEELYKARIRTLASSAKRVLDFGAGRGNRCVDLRPYGPQVLGCDVSEAVKLNPILDGAVVTQPGQALPFPDAHFDLIVSRYVLEHVENPVLIASELRRVLKPGGRLCAITPNKWGYVAVGATIIPSVLHTAVLKAVQPDKRAEDTFPTRYRMNTPQDLFRLFGRGLSIDRMSGPPSYTFGSRAVGGAFEWLHKTMPTWMQTTMVVQYERPH